MDSFSELLVAWYDQHARALPWRVPPIDSKQGVRPDPYHVLLSEVMLQQTTVSTVKAYFEKFIQKWPTIADMAAASQDDIMKEWAGLGYYSRARNLKTCADVVVTDLDSRLPATQSELAKLPGIGDYTSAAIASIAFGQRAAVVDGNIERVVARQTANSTLLPKLKDAGRTFMDKHTPEDRPGDFAQAMMDLGATICTSKSPACALCPVNMNCMARKAGTMLNYPVKKPKKAKPVRMGAAFVCTRSDGAVWLQRRPDTGLLGGMSTVPTNAWTASIDGETGYESVPFESDWQKMRTITHTFTHFHLELEVWLTKTEAVPIRDGWWSLPDELSGEALPTVIKKVVNSALPNALKHPTKSL